MYILFIILNCPLYKKQELSYLLLCRRYVFSWHLGLHQNHDDGAYGLTRKTEAQQIHGKQFCISLSE